MNLLSGKEVLNGKGVKPFTKSEHRNAIGHRSKGSVENNRWDEEKKRVAFSLIIRRTEKAEVSERCTA